MEAPLDKTTRFPKIGKSVDVIKLLEKVDPDAFQRDDTKLALIGTVKLHGTHNDIVIDAAGCVRLQSRNVLDIQNAQLDSYGFSKFMKDLTPVLLDLKRQYHERFTALNPEIAIDPAHPLIIAGEFIGEGIQKGVAISQLSRRFVILAVSINGAWLPDEDYSGLANEDAGICNISRGGFCHESLDLADVEGSMERIQQITDKLELECPFAKTFDVDGIGEGIVWKLRERAGSADFWFKTKIAQFSGRGKPVKAGEPAEKHEYDQSPARILATNIVTDRRLEQGLEYLTELGIEGKKRLGIFIKWVVQDCLVEEREAIREAGVNQAALSQAISKLAKDWFIGYSGGDITGK